jgi:Protein of unknown function (DUF1670)
MIRTPDRKRKYQSAHDRLLKPGIINFFTREFPGFFGPVVRENIAEALINLFESLCPNADRLKPGQIIWNALDVKTRADSPNRRYKPVILTVVSDEEISMFENGKSTSDIRKNVIARIIKEAYHQGGILSMRDLSLMLVLDASYISHLRIEFEQDNQTVLPHTGVIHDMGSTISHKRQIVFKYVVEKKDPKIVALETNHSQLAVDKYLKDYQRVKTLTDEQKNLDYIHMVTNIAKPVIKQYQQIIENYVKEPV